MKTFNTVKNEVALNYGYANWNELEGEHNIYGACNYNNRLQEAKMIYDHELYIANQKITEFMQVDIIASTSEGLPRSTYSKLFKTFAECERFCEGINAKSDVHKENNDRYFPMHYRGEMKYHCSYDWLMPVVERIGKIDQEWLKENICPEVEEMMTLSIFTPIDVLFETVVKFIEWFNQNK